MTSERNIVVTGFGLFRDHKLNPSWEAIRDGQLQIDRANFNIITKGIQVSYEAVDKEVENLWNIYKPILMVHVGLAQFETTIRLEKRARHGPYINDDVIKCAPHKHLRLYQNSTVDGENINVENDYICKPCQFDSSETSINLERICDRLNQLYCEGKSPIPFKCSEDAGLYVCEYIYQKSLRICDRTIFIHVPDLSDKFKLTDIRISIKRVIETIVDELFKNDVEIDNNIPS